MFAALIGELAAAAGGGLLDQIGGIGEGIGGFMDDPGGSMMDAMKDTDLAALITDPETYMNKRVEDFQKNQGRAPSPSEFSKLQKQMEAMREQAMQSIQGSQIPMQMGGFINQNPNFLNTAQQRLG
tara:strand:- start:245 stop:622 length:378 start_codon:yes stop_codon:yes gene_type:complete